VIVDLSVILRDEALPGRFWSKVTKGGKNDCWLWQAQRDALGYGRIKLRSGQPALAHRVSYVLANGNASGLVCHTCDNPSCVNPSHLFCGTPLDNIRDMDAKGRRICNAPRRVLKANDVKAIRDSNERPGVLANHYGVSRQTIRNVRSFRTWKTSPAHPMNNHEGGV
jgi:HNH endonuclease